MRYLIVLALLFLGFSLPAQTGGIKGKLLDAESLPVFYANVVLYQSADSSLVKVETSDDLGVFHFREIPVGNYFLVAKLVGSEDIRVRGIFLESGALQDLGTLVFEPMAIELAEATVTASRSIVEIKPDRTVFNVQGTINSAGSDGLNLLRKAPGVTIDNNDNISVLGRNGVLVYVDGKRLPLSGQDLANYLQNLSAEQIDRIDIITSPGARYEAEGNAGIIDIRLKKDESHGANGTLGSTMNQGRYNRFNSNLTGNFRNRFMNVFGAAGYQTGSRFHRMNFTNYMNGLFLDEQVFRRVDEDGYDVRLGSDFFLNDQNTIGFVLTRRSNYNIRNAGNRIALASQATPDQIDSILVADGFDDFDRKQRTYNLNYRYSGKNGRQLTFDLDYGQYLFDNYQFQPNRYFDPTETEILTEVINTFDTPSDIDIYTLKLDYEQKVAGGRLSVGTKLSRVFSDNTFLFYDLIAAQEIRNDQLSNRFEYAENVIAGYVNFSGPLSETLDFSVGLRTENTDAQGDLQAFLPELQEPPVKLDYLNWFPNAGLTWKLSADDILSLNYGRRINRPDYNVLNPFNSQLSQLSYQKGNPFLRPEIVNNIEVGYTLNYRYNFKLAYSRTFDQITRLIGPDEEDPRSSFITWDNLARQTIISANISAPVQVTKWWNAYLNLSASHQNNQSDHGNGAVIDLQVINYNIYQQHTFDLPLGFKGELSGYYSGPGIWGGVFEYDSNWALNLGLQKKFFREKLNARLTVNDIFFESGWSGVSRFNGLEARGMGYWDSRRAALSLSYQFGNQKVKSRKRKTGLEEEAGRLGE